MNHDICRCISLKADGYPADFTFYPNFFSHEEQRLLLSAALHKLDMSENRKVRRRQRELLASGTLKLLNSIEQVFLPDEYYTFEEGHYDNVIRRYREIHVSSWPDDQPELQRLLQRLQELHPPVPTQTHILHLASDGEIQPHVDNTEASGSWILGVSLGSPRGLRLENAEDPSDTFEMILPSGSVYIQRDSTRYNYKHSILLRGDVGLTRFNGGQRLSIMIRVRQNYLVHGILG
ncbi:hypothetical protein PHLGIDRAFT_104744 [Phlebiopsis gigantea 11061_1 CR5-6]|uniref:Fe2OG dioxygenase domain-containing protein n=1 Tax=Phlebiopsis gigantea (strain 11061_1 CR5-6) TaxID=745531 RepID=A0A0C3NSF7_PHLG1|nr:hypothetical protein PHLGIDRAFT_104744 [Phlebiopsis gigantea 11061_1 CR5-6]